MTETVPKSPDRTAHVLFGLLAVIPAFVLLLSGYVVPTVRTVLASFTDVDMLGRDAEQVGLENYADSFPDFAAALVWPLVSAVLVTLTAVVGGGTLAYLAARAGRAGRWTVRIAFALPLAGLATAGAAASWMLTFDRSPDGVNPLLAQYLTFFGLAVGLGATAFLLVFRRSTQPRDTWAGALLVSGVLAASALAIGLQSFGFPYVLGRTADGPRYATPTVLIFDQAFRTFRLGAASAVAVLLGLLLAVLGIGVTVWLILARTRVVPTDQPASAEQGTAPVSTTGWRVAASVVAGGLLLLGLAGLTPWLLNSVGFDTAAVRGSLFTHLAFTWLPPLISTVVGALAAALAGYGIGALRPLGRRSELLLLPFAPWLFVGLAGLAPDAWMHRTEDGSAFLFLIPPASLTIPVLFGSTLLFRGVRWTRALPAVGLAALITWVVQAQDTLWPIIAGYAPDSAPMQVVVLQAIQMFGAPDAVPTGWLYPLPVLLVVAAAVAAVQVLVLDRLALRTGRDTDTETPAPAPDAGN
ncbi:sugar ABC transporter permease [Catellatospora chokoriensis]|uniref:ABC-type sugar transport system, permease component n=1 Tax=Catellatospora chokoriensis TaxID=310353 RepID=A0A8J3JYD8_9ACTN|nr:sugar ABC transporter permease [Catellatospora chokoriensis]GIF93392.1 hypothetical protein Cch02nite_68360 [Catellatospora chokoriensis]